MTGNIIFLNGASSAGKSTLAMALQERLPLPFWHYSIDHLAFAKVLPSARIDSGEFPWPAQRERFFEGFHRSIPAFSAAGNNLIVEHIIENESWLRRLVLLLDSQDVFFVGLHCPLEELERRARLRAGRKLDEARADFRVTHTFGAYDLECTSTEAADEVAEKVIEAWNVRGSPSAFAKMRSKLREHEGAA